MFVLKPSNKDLFESQTKHILQNLWLSEFDYITKVPENATIETRRHRFGLRGNRYLNVIAEIYGYDSYSSMLALSNEDSNSSPWIGDHDELNLPAEEMYAKVIGALGYRHKSTLKGGEHLLAVSFVTAIKDLPTSSINDATPELIGFPYLQLVDYYTDGGVSFMPQELVNPEFDDDGEVVPNDEIMHTLEENTVIGDRDVRESISPYFSSLEQAEEFFKGEFSLYSKYIINVDARYADSYFTNKVSDFASTLWGPKK